LEEEKTSEDEEGEWADVDREGVHGEGADRGQGDGSVPSRPGIWGDEFGSFEQESE
jgi:hypothetical protein